MFELSSIRTIGIMILLAAVVILLLRRIKIPNIVAYIITGLILIPFINLLYSFNNPNISGDTFINLEGIKIISKVGIALLLFLVGLELSFKKIRDVGKVAVIAGLGQVIFTAIGGFAIAVLLQFSTMESLFLAVALTFSSTVVVVKLLDQKRELYTLYGSIAVGIFLVQDLVVIIVLTLLAGIGADTSLQPFEVTLNITKAFAGMGALLALALISSKYLLPRPFAWAARSPETLFIWSLGWCFIFVLLAEKMNLSLEIGAFLAGISLAQLPCSHDLHRRVHPLVNFFIALFFISLGAQMELSAAKEYLIPAVILSLFVLIGNPIIFIWIIGKMGYDLRTSFLTSVTVAQISEFSFIFAAVGLSAGLIAPPLISLIALIGLITIAVSSYMIIYNHELYEVTKRTGLLSFFPSGTISESKLPPKYENHIIIVGMNSLGRYLALELQKKGETVLAIDTDPGKMSDISVKKIIGDIDYFSVLEEASIERAKLVISALQIETTNNLLAYRCKQLGIPVAIHAFDSSVIEDLKRLEVDFLIDSKRLSSDALFTMIMKEAGVNA